MGKFGSINYHQAKVNKDLLTTPEAAEYLGISENWLRKNLAPSEWHHSKLKYGDAAKAYFWNRDHLNDLKDFVKSGNEDDLFFIPEKPRGTNRKEREWNLTELRNELIKAKQKRDIMKAKKFNAGLT
jgi:hypothetical protein